MPSNNSMMSNLNTLDDQGVLGASSPGKVILFGEHSVVYGKRAIALSIGLRTHILADLREKANVILDFSSVGLKLSWSLSQMEELFAQLDRTNQDIKSPCSMTDQDKEKYQLFLEAGNNRNDQTLCLEAFLHLYTSILTCPVPFVLKCDSDIPVGGGLGSSASFGVCLCTVLLNISAKLNGNSFTNADGSISASTMEAIRQWAFESEKIFHGTPSGIDNAVCTFGGGVSFKEGRITNIKVDTLKVFLVNTRVTRSTRTLVSKVQEKCKKFPSIFEPILTAMDKLADSACVMLQQTGSSFIEKRETLEELIEINHSLLRVLDVSHPSLEKIVSIAKSFGLAAKLTGAGGGGFAVILGRQKKEFMERCRQVLEAHGFQTWETELGAPGVNSYIELL